MVIGEPGHTRPSPVDPQEANVTNPPPGQVPPGDGIADPPHAAPFTAPDAPEPPADRYGPDTRSRDRLLGYGLAGFLVTLLVAWAAWTAADLARVPVRWSDAVVVPRDDGTVEVTFQVTKDPDVTAECTVEALNGDLAQVGLVEVTVAPAGTSTVTVQAVVPTTEDAAGGKVRACVVH